MFFSREGGSGGAENAALRPISAAHAAEWGICMKKLALAPLLLALALLLTACGVGGAVASRLVQGNLDAIYFGEPGEDYLELVNATPEDIEETYQQGMEVEAQTFAYYYSVDYLPDDLLAEIADMYKQIYQSAKYEVGTASELSDGSYAVPVTVYPLNILELVNERGAEYTEAYNAQFTDGQIASMTEEEYMEYDAGWARTIVQCCLDCIPDMDYMEPESLVIQVAQDSDGYWRMNEDDFAAFDAVVIYYP